MELQSKAQDLSYAEIVVEDDGVESSPIILTPISMPVEPQVVEVLENAEPTTLESGSEVIEPGQIEIVIDDLGEIPGLMGQLDPAKEQLLEVIEEPEKDNKKNDANDAKTKTPKDSWDWEAKGHEGFLEWVKERFSAVPKHSGYDSSGLERAVSYLEKLDNEISKAMRLDLDSKLDANKIEDIRSKIEDGIERLYDRLEKVKKKNKKKKTSFVVNDETLVKEAGTPFPKGIYIMAPLFISCIARILINGNISAGHDMEEMFKKLSTKYKLSEREKMETVQLLSDMGYYVRQDRGLIDEDVDTRSSDNFDWAANYKA